MTDDSGWKEAGYALPPNEFSPPAEVSQPALAPSGLQKLPRLPIKEMLKQVSFSSSVIIEAK